MPQFDFFSFSTQVFWILIAFFYFYFFILRFYLLKVSQALKLRRILKTKQVFAVNTYDYILLLFFKKK